MKLKKLRSLFRRKRPKPNAADAFLSAVADEEATGAAVQAEIADRMVQRLVSACLPDCVGQPCTALGVHINQGNITGLRPCIRCNAQTRNICVVRLKPDVLADFGQPADALMMLLYTICRDCHRECGDSDAIATEVGEKVVRMALEQEVIE